MEHPLSQRFFSLTPDRVLFASELGGQRATGYVLPLNSLENRVFDVEMEDGTHLILKFYRPGRWSKEAILDEHAFLFDLTEAEVPVVAPLYLRGTDETLYQLEDSGLFFAAFPKVRGRVPEELTDADLRQLGRLVARLHLCGKSKVATHRPRLTATTYGRESLQVVLGSRFLPLELASSYERAATAIIDAAERGLPEIEVLRIHGDCHLGNLLFGYSSLAKETSRQPFFLDFDDFVMGPAVQDLWLLCPGDDEEAIRQRSVLCDGYEEMRPLDGGRSSLRYVEILRGLRLLRYAAWIVNRYQDPSFPKAFPRFPEHQHWVEEIDALTRALRGAKAAGVSG